MSYLQAIVIGLLQGVTELFPVSSLGHSVLIAGWLGWDKLLSGQSADESFYLAFLVGLHVATALALVWFFRRDWIEIVRNECSNTSPTMPTGIVARISNQAMRSLGLSIRRWRIELNSPRTMATQSRRKNQTSANAVAT